MKKLVMIDRHGEAEFSVYFEECNTEVIALNPYHTAEGVQKNTRNISFFLVHDKKVDAFVEYASKQNPGCEIQVYTMSKVGQCPAGDYVVKDVTKDGVLPT